MERSGSFSSQGSGNSGYSGASSGVSAAGPDNAKNQEGQQDLLEQQQSFAVALFGVLFTLSKEKVDSSRKFAVAKILLDYIQLLVLVVHPSFGWEIDEKFWLWKAIETLNLKNPIVSKGYNFYIAILYIVASVLLLSLGLCVWVGWCFKNQRFPFVWPIKVLRLFVSVFFQVFYIAALGVFLVAIDCHFLSDDDPNAQYKKHRVQAFQEVECLKMPHLAHLAVSIVLIVLFIIIALTVTAADFELNPVSTRWLAAASSSVEFRAVLIRTVATLSFALLDDLRKLQALIITACMCLMCWSFIRWEPHMYEWANHVRAGMYGSLSWAAAMLCVLVYHLPNTNDPKFPQKMSTTMLAGLAPFWLVFMFVSWVRFRFTYNRALDAVRNAPAGANLRMVYRWPDVETVEMVSRVCRKRNPQDEDELDQDAVKLGEQAMKGGMAFYSTNPQMLLLYSNFLIEVTGAYQSGHSQLSSAKSLSPNYTQQFIIFVREQMHMQRSQTQASGETSVDLVSYVEFQRNYRLLVSCHRAALMATRAFWRLLLHSEVQFTALAKAFHIIETSQARAEKMYKNVLERYPSSAKILRLYARFLEEVKNDPWTAAQFYAESEKMEEAVADTSLLAGGGDDLQSGGQVDERNNPVCVINANGIIQMVNKVLVETWGYKRDELNGKNVSMLMPNPFASKHNTFLRNYLTTGKARILDRVREVLALHKDKYCFPIKICVTKVSGEGADSVFMGVFKYHEEDHSLVRAYCSPTGIVLTCDARYVDWFGKTVNECVGRHFGSLAVEQDKIEAALLRAAEMSEEELATGKVSVDATMLHKFSDPVPCTVTLTMGGTETQRLTVMTIRRKVVADMMMCTDTHGRIMYITTALAHFLNYEPKELVKTSMNKLLSQPFAQLHNRWMKAPPGKVPTNSCRANFTVTIVPKNKPSQPVRCEIITREMNEQTVYVVVIEPSTFEDGLDERRLRLELDPEHDYLVVKSLVGHPRAVFGQKPETYVGMHLSRFVDAFRVARENHTHEGALTAGVEIMEELVKKARELPGQSFRLGVHAPMSDDKFITYRQHAKEAEEYKVACEAALKKGDPEPPMPQHVRQFNMERQLLAKETRSVRLVCNLEEKEDSDEPPRVILELIHSEAITGIVEIDNRGKIIKPGCCPLHQSGPIFGHPSARMTNRNIRHFLPIPPGMKPIEYLMMDDREGKKKSALKKAHTLKKEGPNKHVVGTHTDGKPLNVMIQCIQKLDNPNRYQLRCHVFKPSTATSDFLSLVKNAGRHQDAGMAAMSDAGTDWLGRMHANDTSSSDEEDDRGKHQAPLKQTTAQSKGLANAASHSQHGSPPPLHHASTLDDDEQVKERESGDLVGDLLDGKVVGKEGNVRASRGEAQLPHSGSKDMESPKADGKGKVKGDSARPSEEQPRGGPAAKPKPAQKAGRRAMFQLDEDQAAGHDMEAKTGRAGSPQGRGGGGANKVVAPQDVHLAQGDINDGMSDKSSESGMSSSQASSAMSYGEGGGATAALGDYRRGKRYKRLQIMLTSKENLATLRQFQVQSAMVTAALMVVHIVCFVVLMMILEEQANIVKELEASGDAMDYMHRVNTYTVSLNNMYHNRSAGSNVYDKLWIPSYDPTEIAAYTKKMENEIRDFEIAHQGAYLGFKKLRRLKDMNGIPLRSTWEQPIQATKIWVDTLQSYEQEVNLTLWQLGNDWTSAAREIMSNHKLIYQRQNGTLESDRNYYFMMYNGPFSLYNAYRKLLTGMVDWSIYEADKVTQTLLILLVIEACVCVAICVSYLVRLLARVGSYRFSLFSTFLVVPTSFLRALASKKVIVGDEQEDSDDDDDEQAAAEANKAVNAASAGTTGGPPAIGGPLAVGTKARKATAAAQQAAVVQTTSIWTSLKKMFSMNKTQQLSMHGKRLNKSAFDSMYLLSPFFLWAALIVAIYAVSYAWLRGLAAPVTMVNVMGFIRFRVSRAVFFANILCSQTDVAGKTYWQELLPQRIIDMGTEWDVMVLGPSGTTNPQYNRAESVLWRGMQHQEVVYRMSNTCQRDTAANGACFPEGHFYYHNTHNGMGYMMRRLIEEMTLLSGDALDDINLNSTRLTYMYNIGLNDLRDGITLEYKLYSKLVEDVLGRVKTLHIVLLVLSLLLSAFFILFMVRPFMKRANKESRRVAELLSQLPTDLDVEAMVNAVLQAASWRAKKKGAGEAGGPEGALLAGADDPDGMGLMKGGGSGNGSGKVSNGKGGDNGKGKDDDNSSVASSQ